MRKTCLLIPACFILAMASMSAQTRANGFYKDLFIDSGPSMTNHEYLAAARVLNLSTEVNLSYNSAQNATPFELARMQECFVGTDQDENGLLLYPDGAPRFRLLYVPGGTANRHGECITEEGRAHIREFFRNGGSYSSSCAGTILCSKGYYYKDRDGKPVDREMYIGVWPGYTTGTRLFDSWTTLTVDKKSPLLDYYDFGGDMRVDSVRHNNGSYFNDYMAPEGTESLLRFKADTIQGLLYGSIDGQTTVLGYKPDAKSGRMVSTGSHPEIAQTGEVLQLFTAMLHYALDGNGAPQVKAALTSGEAREMTASTRDGKPEYTMLGDKQYHHFTIDVPKGAKEVAVELKSVKGRSNYDLFLYAAPGQFAFNDVARWFDVSDGIDKVMVIRNPKPGKLYISVFCDTTVDAVSGRYGTQYSGRTDVLNGVPYIIKATVTK